MAKQTLEQLQVKDKDSVVIKGQVTFARLDKLVEGEALDKENERRRQQGRITADKPFRSVTISNPEIVAGKGTPLATYYGQSVYNTKDGNQAMSFESKSPFAPKFAHIQNGKLVEIADPMKNPAPGQEIYIMLEAYSPKNFSKMGASFTQIAYGEGEIEYYGGGAASLEGFGQALGLQVQAQAPQADAGVTPAPAPQQVQAPVQNTFAQPEPQAQTQPAPQTDANLFGVPDNQASNTFGASGQSEDNPFA